MVTRRNKVLFTLDNPIIYAVRRYFYGVRGSFTVSPTSKTRKGGVKPNMLPELGDAWRFGPADEREQAEDLAWRCLREMKSPYSVEWDRYQLRQVADLARSTNLTLLGELLPVLARIGGAECLPALRHSAKLAKLRENAVTAELLSDTIQTVEDRLRGRKTMLLRPADEPPDLLRPAEPADQQSLLRPDDASG